MEDPSLLKCLKNTAYDQFYCEHIYVFSTLALKNILNKFNFEIFDIENVNTHGGSNRYFIKKRDNRFYKISANVKKEISKEIRFGLNKFSTYKKFSSKVRESKKKLFNILKTFNSILNF